MTQNCSVPHQSISEAIVNWRLFDTLNSMCLQTTESQLMTKIFGLNFQDCWKLYQAELEAIFFFSFAFFFIVVI